MTLEHVFTLAVLGFIAYSFWSQRWFGQPYEVDLVEEIAKLGFIDVEVVKDDRGRMRVAIFYWVTSDFTARALLTSDQAFRLARHLRVAASPGRNVALARLAFARARREASPGTIVIDESGDGTT